MSAVANAGPVLVVLAAGRARRYGGVKPLAPVGPTGEAVLDLLCSDAISAGFSAVVLVIGPHTGPAIRYHVERTWPASVDVRFALQEAPLGTVDAVLAATPHLDPGAPYGVCNADDLYPFEALRLLADHLRQDPGTQALVGFSLAGAVLGDGPVTRGVCETDDDGMLRTIVERRQVSALGDGRFAAKDGLTPSELDGDALVSLNLWGFGPEMPAVLAAAMAEAKQVSEENEVLLPEVVGDVVRGSGPGGLAAAPFKVLPTDGRCIGVTHPEDLALAQAEVAAQVGTGERPALLWSAER
jgi:hypothetical protein